MLRIASGYLLTAGAAVLVVAFVFAPRMLAGGDFADEAELRTAFGESFAAQWRTGAATPELDAVVDYWFRYHVAKAALAALLLVVLVALAVGIWKRFAHNRIGTGRRIALAGAGSGVTLLGLLALLTVLANVQGALAPYASLLPMLSAPELADVRGPLSEVVHADATPGPVLDAMIGDFARFHAVLAVVAALTVATLAVLAWTAWRLRGTGTTQRIVVSYGVLSALTAAALVVVVVANTTTAADPGPALLAFVDGGW